MILFTTTTIVPEVRAESHNPISVEAWNNINEAKAEYDRTLAILETILEDHPIAQNCGEALRVLAASNDIVSAAQKVLTVSIESAIAVMESEEGLFTDEVARIFVEANFFALFVGRLNTMLSGIMETVGDLCI